MRVMQKATHPPQVTANSPLNLLRVKLDSDQGDATTGFSVLSAFIFKSVLNLYNGRTFCSQILRETVLKKKKTVRRTLRRVRKKMRMTTVEMKVQSSC